MTKKILNVDDHGIISAGFEKLLQEVPGGAMVGSARDGAEALRLVRGEAWDLVVLDISLKGRNGLEVLKDIKDYNPHLPVLMFSLHTSVEFVRRALKNGASGYVSKDSSEAELLKAVNTVLAGGKYVNAELRDALIFSPATGSHSDLSEREFEVLIGIGAGKTVKEIAGELNISESTVETYRSRIKLKMGMSRDAELIHYCIKAGLVQIEAPIIGAEPSSPQE